ncbi:hypothetical protein Tco_0299722 [Tanacetum coccineum]
MHTIGMTMQQVQVNTKFLNALSSKWSKFVTDVNRERYPDSLAFVANSPTLYNPSQSPQHSAEFPQLDSSLAVPMFQQGEDPIECFNKAMAFLSTIESRPRNVAWFKEKLMLAEAQEAGQILDEEQLAFLTDLAKAVLMANLSSCDPEVLSELPYSDSYPNDMINQDTNPSAPNSLLVLSLVEQMTDHVPHLDKENQTNKMVNESLTTELERYKERITIFEEKLNIDLNQRKKLIDSQMDNLIRDRNAKLVAFQFAELVTSLNNFPKQTDSLKTKDSNKHLLTSTVVKPTTSASGSKPSGNTKNNRITRPPRSNLKNKVEDHHRKVKSSLNKINSIFEPISNALVKHSVRNATFESICATCNKCLFDANHDMCYIDFVNVHLRSKSKRNKIRKAWKPIGKVFTGVGYKWKPTGRFFTIVGNSCPLTRITPKKIVHLKETTSKLVETPKQEIKIYSRRPKQIKSVGSSKKAKIVESKIANNSESTHLWGSNATDVPSSSSLVNDRLSRSSSS